LQEKDIDVEMTNTIMWLFSLKQIGKGKIVSGENKPVSWCRHLSIHAEMDAMRKIRNHKKKLNLLVVRFSQSGKLCESKPCHHCIQKLKELKLDKVFYSREDESIACEKISNMKNRMSGGHRRNSC